VCLVNGPAVWAQEPQAEPLVFLVRGAVPDSGGTLEFSLTNTSRTDRQARILVYHKARPDVQYGRDIWVPAGATLTTWLLVGPAPEQSSPTERALELLLYDRTGGKDRLLLPPGERRARSLPLASRKRPPTTALLRDAPAGEIAAGPGEGPEAGADEVYRLARTFRVAARLSEDIEVIPPGPLLPTAEALAGIDQVIVASGRLAQDPVGLAALRRWLERGGRVWVLLDQVQVDALAPLLGDALDFQVVDRVTLADFKVQMQTAGPGSSPGVEQQHERPVELVRVLLPQGERAVHTVNGWPAWFTRSVGRGKVVFTTLGPRAWFGPRGDASPSPKGSWPFVPTEPLVTVADALTVPAEQTTVPVEAFRQPLGEEIGYDVVNRGTAALVFGAFLLAGLTLAAALRRSRRPELVGLAIPAAALTAAGAFLGLGELSQQPAATVAVAQVVTGVPGTEDAPVHGLLAVYRPESGPAELGAGRGGFFDLDMSGVEGQNRRFILTDMDAWHWEGLDLPAGVRLATFRYTGRAGEPITAVAHFGPEGLEGMLASGPFREPTDALLATPEGRNLTARLQPDGSFRADPDDVLPAGQFLASAVLTDRQQRRQDLYRQFLKQPEGGDTRPGNLLLAWADPIDMHFRLAADARTVGTALLALPLRLERSAPGTRVHIPGPLVPGRRLVDGRPEPLPGGAHQQALDVPLRFQLPAAVLPLKIERARLVARIDAPGRRVTISGGPEAGKGELHHVDSPVDPIRLDITDRSFLRVDAGGGLHLNLAVGDQPQAGGSTPGARPVGQGWRIDYVELEVTGRTEDDKVTR
jgi:hypothetical protein